MSLTTTEDKSLSIPDVSNNRRHSSSVSYNLTIKQIATDEIGEPTRRHSSDHTNNIPLSDSLHAVPSSSVQSKIALLRTLNSTKNLQSVSAAAVAAGTAPRVRSRRQSSDDDVGKDEHPTAHKSSSRPHGLSTAGATSSDGQKTPSGDEVFSTPSPSTSFRVLALKALEERKQVRLMTFLMAIILIFISERALGEVRLKRMAGFQVLPPYSFHSLPFVLRLR